MYEEHLVPLIMFKTGMCKAQKGCLTVLNAFKIVDSFFYV